MDDICQKITNFNSKLHVFLLNIRLHSIRMNFQTRIVAYNNIYRKNIKSLKYTLLSGSSNSSKDAPAPWFTSSN